MTTPPFGEKRVYKASGYMLTREAAKEAEKLRAEAETQAEEQRRLLAEAEAKAEEERRRAEELRRLAEIETQLAKKQKLLAKSESARADEQQRRAEVESRRAEEQARLVEVETQSRLEHLRAARRFRWATIFLAVLFLIALATTTYAFYSRSIAEQLRRDAVYAQKVAVDAKDYAERARGDAVASKISGHWLEDPPRFIRRRRFVRQWACTQ